jgi:predicted Zn-dependent protease
MKRRNFIIGSGALIASGAGITGGILGRNNTLEISIFADKEAYNILKEREKLRKSIVTQVEGAINRINDGGCNVRFIQEPVDIDLSKGDENTMSKWEDKLSLDYHDYSSEHSNLLITTTRTKYRGQGHVGCMFCGTESFVSVYDRLEKADSGEIRSGYVGLNSDEVIIHNILHEIGHNLGLEHNQGYAWRDGNDVYITPMLGLYLFNSDMEKNKYGKELPSEFDVDEDNYYMTTYYNKSISI